MARHHGGKYYEEAVYGSDDGSTDGSDTGGMWFFHYTDRDDGCGDEGGNHRSCSRYGSGYRGSCRSW